MKLISIWTCETEIEGEDPSDNKPFKESEDDFVEEEALAADSDKAGQESAPITFPISTGPLLAVNGLFHTGLLLTLFSLSTLSSSATKTASAWSATVEAVGENSDSAPRTIRAHGGETCFPDARRDCGLLTGLLLLLMLSATIVWPGEWSAAVIVCLGEWSAAAMLFGLELVMAAIN